ncbi:hypothetical protein LDJ81_12810, partial [Lentilactobacillus parabuchneri]|uniref:hypothetical protein n=1 Tax=Lentilactobacillus parabuchneri TaxID=152331 RepID=UPI0022369BBA
STPAIALANLIGNIKSNTPAGYIPGNALNNNTSSLYGQLSVARFGQSFNVPVTAAQTLSSDQLQTIFNKLTITFTGDNATRYTTNAPVADNVTTLQNWLSQGSGARLFGGKGGDFYANALSSFKNNTTLQKVANGGTVSQADFIKALSDAGLGTIFVAHNDDANTWFNTTGHKDDRVDTITLSYAENRAANITLDSQTNAPAINLTLSVSNNSDAGWVESTNSNAFHGPYGQNNWTAPGSSSAEQNQ